MNFSTQIYNLSKREQQVAFKITEGLPNKIIACDLFISERTVKFHCANIYRKLRVPSRAALMANYFRDIQMVAEPAANDPYYFVDRRKK